MHLFQIYIIYQPTDTHYTYMVYRYCTQFQFSRSAVRQTFNWFDWSRIGHAATKMLIFQSFFLKTHLLSIKKLYQINRIAFLI